VSTRYLRQGVHVTSPAVLSGVECLAKSSAKAKGRRGMGRDGTGHHIHSIAPEAMQEARTRHQTDYPQAGDGEKDQGQRVDVWMCGCVLLCTVKARRHEGLRKAHQGQGNSDIHLKLAVTKRGRMIRTMYPDLHVYISCPRQCSVPMYM